MKKFSRNTLLALCLGVSAVLSGCGGIGSNDSSTFMPLESNNHWTYKDVASGDTTVEKVTGVKTIGGVNAFVLKDTQGNETYMTTDLHSIRIVGAADVTEGLTPVVYSPMLQVLALPLQVGASWTQDVVIGSGDPLTYKFTVAAKEAVDVPAGHFANCYRIDETITNTSGKKLTGRAWFAENVGMVRSQYINPIEATQQEQIIGEQVLTEYQLY